MMKSCEEHIIGNRESCIVVYDAIRCPLCSMIEKASTLEEENSSFEDEVNELQGKVEDLEDEVDDLKTQLMGKDND